jgi:hypothetical protein
MEKNKREPYVSIDRDERDILRSLSHRERALYMELKWLADFKTGAVKKFGKRVVSYQMLADLITVPARQGRAPDVFDAKEACRLLMRLHDAGLVGEITNDPAHGLTFALPLSPIAKEAARQERQREGAERAKLPSHYPSVKGRGVPKTEGLSVENRGQSVMTMLEEHQYPFHNTDAVDDAAGRPAAARGVAAGDPPGIWLAAGATSVSGATAALTVEAIKQALRARKFNYVETGESALMYERWLTAGCTLERLNVAVEAVAQDFDVMPTPAKVDEELRRPGQHHEAAMREQQRRERRGRVAL